ncbi:SMI1/KNR4 family protein [Pedobacter fastidiosus]|uniref:SMI1/KNR4 family protein n=1 Tax=Pedobacter fastidiosus TaxID=2765361 RepID=A0ABR7KVF7_9SPHI|nr:SMI1/KNR4 family protein [Pedobacter fastidiosus]MBC6111815.1 SMI1/KNR4 family protein [Pedobacter fastidiosus]
MKKILKKISETAIRQGEFTFNDEQIESKWLGNAPASPEEIKQLEEKLQIILPKDYKAFLAITNGFKTPNENIEPSFEKTDQVGFLKDIDPEIIEVWINNDELLDVAIKLSRSIVVGGINEEQYFLLVPPLLENGGWEYWKFASWIPGEDPYEGMENYFINALDFLKSA